MGRGVYALLLLIFGLGLVGCDHATKTLAREHLAGSPPVELVEDRLELRYVENPGVGFSLERVLDAKTTRWLVPLGRALALLVLVFYWWQRRREARWIEHVGFVLVLSGALGNAVEGWIRGVVVDFVHLHGWPVFNAADVYLAVGIGLVLLATWRSRAAPAAPV